MFFSIFAFLRVERLTGESSYDTVVSLLASLASLKIKVDFSKDFIEWSFQLASKMNQRHLD